MVCIILPFLSLFVVFFCPMVLSFAAELLLMKLVPVFAFGTRGDVSPVFAILHRLATEVTFTGPVKFVLVTHLCFASECASAFHYTNVEVLGVKTSPIAVSENDCFYENYVVRFKEKYIGCEVVLIMSNLFALDSWLYALECNVQCIFIHPNLPSPDLNMKHQVLSELESLHPLLFRYLLKHMNASQDFLCWTDYERLLWPTLVSDYLETQSRGIETAFTRHTAIHGPVMLLLSSPKFAHPPLDGQWLSRYHTCGFVTDSSITKHMKLEVSLTGTNGELEQNNPVHILHNTEDLLRELAEQAGRNSMATVCVDFGSMTQVLVEQDRLQYFLAVLLQISPFWRIVVVCHGYSAHISEMFIKVSTGTGTTSAASLANIVLMSHAVDHMQVFPKCVTVIHHGGIGTIGACMHSGVPQLILAVIYDQMSNGARVQELGLGECQSYDMLSPEASPSASTHPNTPRNTSNSPYDHDNDRSIVVGSMVTSSAVSLVEEALRRCSAPSQRLRCACYGRDLRADPAEDGVTNAVALLTQYMRAFVHQPTGSLVEPGKAASHTKSNAAQPLPQCEADEFAYTVNEHGRLVLPNGLQVYTHFTTAPEETVFLYEEIFVHKVYQAAVQGLRPGDLVVDVGANVGMFSIYASRTVQQIVRCDNDCNSHRSEPLRILAVEPMKANFELLVQNARHCVLDCTAYNCAIAASAVDTADGAPADDCNGTQLFGMVRVVRCRNGICSSEHIPCAATKEMHYYPRMPGNSCSADNASSNLAALAHVMNPAVLSSACATAAAEQCPVLSLSALLSDYWGRQGQNADDTVDAADPAVAVAGLSAGVNKGRPKRTASAAFDHPSPTKDISYLSRAQTPVPALALVPFLPLPPPLPPPLPQRVALLKVDVEGDELGVLQSLSAAHWVYVHRVILEAAPHLEGAIVDLLLSVGFVQGNIKTDRGNSSEADYTGNLIIFATRQT